MPKLYVVTLEIAVYANSSDTAESNARDELGDFASGDIRGNVAITNIEYVTMTDKEKPACPICNDIQGATTLHNSMSH